MSAHAGSTHPRMLPDAQAEPFHGPLAFGSAEVSSDGKQGEACVSAEVQQHNIDCAIEPEIEPEPNDNDDCHEPVSSASADERDAASNAADDTTGSHAHDATLFDASGDIFPPPLSPSVALPGDALASVESLLAAEIGPVARLLVMQYAPLSSDLSELAARLLQHIPTNAGRENFNAAVVAKVKVIEARQRERDALAPATPPQGQPDGEPASANGGTAPSPEQVQAAALRLAHYLGPVAYLIAKREACVAPDLITFQENLARSIASEADRTAFKARFIVTPSR